MVLPVGAAAAVVEVGGKTEVRAAVVTEVDGRAVVVEVGGNRNAVRI